MKTLLTFLLFISLLTGLIDSIAGSAHAADKKPAAFNHAILGFALGDCAPRDIYSKLGPGISFKDEAREDATQVCYVSDRDETLILFSFENFQCSRIRLLSQKKKFYKWHFCEKSPLVSKHLATESGIKLGMSKGGLKAILGSPRSESDENLTYAFEWMLKRNTAETGKDSRAAKKAAYKTVKITIRTEFSDAKLILFDVSKSMQ